MEGNKRKVKQSMCPLPRRLPHRPLSAPFLAATLDLQARVDAVTVAAAQQTSATPVRESNSTVSQDAAPLPARPGTLGRGCTITNGASFTCKLAFALALPQELPAPVEKKGAEDLAVPAPIDSPVTSTVTSALPATPLPAQPSNTSCDDAIVGPGHAVYDCCRQLQ